MKLSYVEMIGGGFIALCVIAVIGAKIGACGSKRGTGSGGGGATTAECVRYAEAGVDLLESMAASEGEQLTESMRSRVYSEYYSTCKARM